MGGGPLILCKLGYFYNGHGWLQDGSYANFDAASLPTMHDNRVFTPSGTVTEAGHTIGYWQAKGHDLGLLTGTLVFLSSEG